MVKILRQVSAGEHPEAEMSRYLTAVGFAHAPPLLGEVVHIRANGTPHTLAVVLGFIRNQGDAWSWTLDHLTRALDHAVSDDAAKESQADLLSDCEQIAAAIGQRLGEMHAVLARETSDPAFAPARAADTDVAGWAQKARQRLNAAFAAIENTRQWAREQDQERANALLEACESLGDAVQRLAKSGEGSVMTRIHGDFHLGQVLVASGDTYIIDFEGEPATSIEERRAKSSPLRDVAGLLRSLDYTGATLIDRKGVGAVPASDEQRNAVVAQFRRRAATAFLQHYWPASGLSGGPAERALLDLFMIEKAAYEITYEAANRPTWIGVPIAGLSAIANRIGKADARGRNG